MKHNKSFHRIAYAPGELFVESVGKVIFRKFAINKIKYLRF